MSGTNAPMPANAPAPANKEVAARPVPPHPLSRANAAERKLMPILSGAIAYFPDALGWVSFVSLVGNTVHNPGQPMHWAQEKSKDHKDCCARHLAGLGTLDDRMLIVIDIERLMLSSEMALVDATNER